jgi:hypothetical protein
VDDADRMAATPSAGRHSTTLEVSRALGRWVHGEWKPYDKRQVLNWCKVGVNGSGPCPADRVPDRSAAGHAYRLNLSEVEAWARDAGLELVRRPDGQPETRAAAGMAGAAAEPVAPLQQAADQARAERLQALRDEAARLMSGDPLDSVRMLLVDLQAMLEESRAKLRERGEAPTGSWLQNLAMALKNIGQEARQLAQVERARDEASGRLMERTAAQRLLGELANQIRQGFAGIGPTLIEGVLAQARQAGVELTSAGAELLERVGAAAAQAAVDAVLARAADAFDRAGAELEQQQGGPKPIEPGKPEGGLFEAAAA